jgi:predicted alpha/beta-hydrolase family hydrolase
MESVARKLAAVKVATLRYNFPYMEAGKRVPDPAPVLTETVRVAVEAGRSAAGGLPLFAGGKSLGGRMTSTAMAEDPMKDVRGLVFFGFPLHRPGKPSTERAEHLARVTVPMLFLQGTRDTLADLETLTPIMHRLAVRGELHVIEGADHSFHVTKSTGRSDDEVLEELAKVVGQWTSSRVLD